MSNFCILDFETVSACDLKRTGARVYAQHPTTEVLCAAYQFEGDQIPRLWLPGHAPFSLGDATLLIAHNAAFEIAIWEEIMEEDYGWPTLPRDWHDTMAACLMRALPAKLEQALAVLRLPMQKDAIGSTLVRKLNHDMRKKGTYDRSPETLQRVGEYCMTDVVAEFNLHRCLGMLPEGERRVWLHDRTVNERGVHIDLPLVRAMQEIVAKASAPLVKEFAKLTDGLSVNQRDKLLDWLRPHGVDLRDLTKKSVAAVLGDDDDEPEEIDAAPSPRVDLRRMDEKAHRALEIRRVLGSAAIKKLNILSECIAADGRAHGVQQYHGACSGRWAGRLFQPHNFPTKTLELDGHAADPETVVDVLRSGDPELVQAVLGEPINAVASSLRHTIMASPGHDLAAGDFMGIEARIVLHMSGQTDKAAMMAAGQDVYCDMASLIFGYPVIKGIHKFERDIGKHAVLGLGYGLGEQQFALKYAPDRPIDFSRHVVKTYRKDWAPCVPKMWYAMHDAAALTVHTKRPHEAYGIVFGLEDGWLYERLPSGRKLWFYNPQPFKRSVPWDENELRPGFSYQAQKKGQWQTVYAHGGLIVGITVQAIDRDLLVWGMSNCEKAGVPVILNVHDECITEPRSGTLTEKMLANILGDVPKWCQQIGIPVGVDAWVGRRYRK